MGKLIISTGPCSIAMLNYQRLDQDFVLIAMVTWTPDHFNLEMDAIAPEAGEIFHEQGQ